MIFMPACDLNVVPTDKGLHFGIENGPYAVHRSCFLKKDVLSYNADYVKQFFDAYKTERKMFTMKIETTHEITGVKSSSVVDPILYDLLQYLDTNGHLDNTIVNFLSNNGDNIGPFGSKTESGKIEMMNPMLFMMVPETLNVQFHENLKKNTQRLTTAYDVFETNLEYLGFSRQYKYGVSMMHTEIPANKTCEQAFVFNPKDNCKCHPKV